MRYVTQVKPTEPSLTIPDKLDSMTTTTLNSLARASSAYLRSAMHQPIQWHEWGPEAFAAAQRDNKPMLLDVGAVWCHWCHVMDRESYDDPEIAAIVNQHFIAVKVDRDERPDIDSRYQAAVQAVSGQGGWPLTAFLTPDGKPFYGGTYFPPQDGYGRPSFRRVLLSIANAFAEKHEDVLDQAKMVESTIAQSESFAGKDGRVSAAVIAAIQTSAFRMFDPQNGGFGQAPKFPHPSALDLLIERYARGGKNQPAGQPAAVPSQAVSTKNEALGGLIVTTLETHGARRGLRPAGGGFSSLFGRRTLGRAALREDVLRQLRTAEKLCARLSGDRRGVFCGRGARHHPLDGRVAERSRARRLLCLAGRRLSTWTTTAITLPGRSMKLAPS
jgi:hypothetical protein